MPLVSTILEQKLKTIFNPQTMPGSIPEAASALASAFDSYASQIIPPSATSAAAKAAFQSAMSGVSPDLKNGTVQLAVGLTAYAVQLGLGMQPAFTATPPAVPINIAPVMALGLGGGSGDQCAALLATITDAWFRTGLAINNSSGVTLPWS